MESREAIKIGFAYLADLFPGDQDVRLEEIEKDAEHDNWLITYSLPGIAERKALLDNPLFLKFGERRLKILTIRASTGEVISMKIRVLHDVR